MLIWLCYLWVYVPRWRNGRRDGLKIRFLHRSESSILSRGTKEKGPTALVLFVLEETPDEATAQSGDESFPT